MLATRWHMLARRIPALPGGRCGGGPGGLPASTGIVCFEGNEEKWIQEVLSYGGVWHKRGGVLEVKHVFCMYRTCAQQLMDLVMGISFSLL